jgi:hypothetical protein
MDMLRSTARTLLATVVAALTAHAEGRRSVKHPRTFPNQAKSG